MAGFKRREDFAFSLKPREAFGIRCGTSQLCGEPFTAQMDA